MTITIDNQEWHYIRVGLLKLGKDLDERAELESQLKFISAAGEAPENKHARASVAVKDLLTKITAVRPDPE